ncbi:hypothetical protein L9F63_015995, partial [Diploptera punctata]
MGSGLYIFIAYTLTVDEIISILEEDNDIIDADIFICSPENALQSDGDSDDEDCRPVGNVNNLSGNQLRGTAELHSRKRSSEGIEKSVISKTDTKTPSTSSTNDIHSVKKRVKSIEGER